MIERQLFWWGFNTDILRQRTDDFTLPQIYITESSMLLVLDTVFSVPTLTLKHWLIEPSSLHVNVSLGSTLNPTLPPMCTSVCDRWALMIIDSLLEGSVNGLVWVPFSVNMFSVNNGIKKKKSLYKWNPFTINHCWLWARGSVHPWQVASSSAGQCWEEIKEAGFDLKWKTLLLA